jgi:hypothetical protein
MKSSGLYQRSMSRCDCVTRPQCMLSGLRGTPLNQGAYRWCRTTLELDSVFVSRV